MIRWLKSLFRGRQIRGYQPHSPTLLASPPMPARNPARDFTDWDVAQEATRAPTHEPGRIEYRFLGVTGLEDE